MNGLYTIHNALPWINERRHYHNVDAARNLTAALGETNSTFNSSIFEDASEYHVYCELMSHCFPLDTCD